MATGVLAARLFGPEGRGELAVIQTWPAILTVVAMLGMPEAIVFVSRGSPGRAGKSITSSVLLAFVASLVVGTAGFLAMPWLLGAQQSHVISATRAYLLILPVTALGWLPFHAFRAIGRYGIWNLFRLLPAGAWLAVLVWASLMKIENPIQVAMTYLGIFTLAGVPIWFELRRYIKIAPPRANEQADLWRFGIPTMTGSLPQMASQRMDQIAITAMLPPGALGIYAVALAWGASVNLLLQGFGTMFFPKVAATDPADASVLFGRGVRVAVAVATVGGAMLMTITPGSISFLFGPKFRSAIPLALVLIGATSVTMLNGVFLEGIKGLGHPKAVLRAELVRLFFGAAALAVLLPTFGLMGAALAGLAGSLVAGSVIVRLAGRYSGLGTMDLIIPRRADLFEVIGRLKRVLGRARAF